MNLKMLGLAAVAAMTLMAFAASSASATTLEVGGSTKNESVTLSASLKSGTSLLLARTDGSFANTCTESAVGGSSTSPFTGTTVGGNVETLSFSSCTRPVTVHSSGTFTVEHTSGTDGTISLSGFEITVGSPFGTLNCKAANPIIVGVLVGAALGFAIGYLTAKLNCGFLVPSASLTGTLTFTSPSGLGVVA